jgi:hypothetical protein
MILMSRKTNLPQIKKDSTGFSVRKSSTLSAADELGVTVRKIAVIRANDKSKLPIKAM